MTTSFATKSRITLIAVAACLTLGVSAGPAMANQVLHDDGDYFYKGATVRLGINNLGTFGSRDWPYSGDFAVRTNDGGLGLAATASTSSPNWDNAIGDFASRWSSWGVQVGSDAWINPSNRGNDTEWDRPTFGGGFTTTPEGGPFVWGSDGTKFGLSATRTFSVKPGTTIVNVVTRLTNTTASPIANVSLSEATNPRGCLWANADEGMDKGPTTQRATGADTTLVTRTRDCDDGNGIITFGMATKAPGSRVGSFCNGYQAFNKYADAGYLLSHPTECWTNPWSWSNSQISVPVGTIAPGATSAVCISYFMNAGDASAAGSCDLPLPLSVVSKAAGATAAAGKLTYRAVGEVGQVFEVSTSPYFRGGYWTMSAGDQRTLTVSLKGTGKGKIGVTRLYVRDRGNRYSTTQAIDLAWDFSVPYITGGRVSTVFLTPYTTVPGQWDLSIKAVDTAPEGARAMRIQFAKGSKPSDSDAFPSAVGSDVVETTSLNNVRIRSAKPPKWARVQDGWGNVSMWKALATAAKYPRVK